MNSSRIYVRYILAFSMAMGACAFHTEAQVNVTTGINYNQVSSFETDYSISALKISGDGTKIVFATSGPQVKVFTMDADGTDLTLVYDFQRTGYGPTVDIDAGGDKVIWCDGEGEVFIANSDGTGLVELATLLPNPDPNFGDLEPVVPLPPRISADGSQVFFINMVRDPRASGVWRVNSDDSDLTMVFNYLDMAGEIFGTDGSEYNYNTAFTDGFDISADGSRMIVGTRIFKLLDGDLDRGNAIAVDGGTFYDMGEYAIGVQPFCTYVDGDAFLMFRREYNEALAWDEINIYFVPLGTGDPVKVLGGIDIFGGSTMTQMAATGTSGIVMGGNGRLPIYLVDKATRSRLDLVSIDRLSIAMGGYRFSESRLPSLTLGGDKFCFLSTSIPPQIWIGTIQSDVIDSEPGITLIQFDPDEVAIDGSTTSTVSAQVTSEGQEIHTVTFDAYQDGDFIFRGITSDGSRSGVMVDDGSMGDATAGDHYFTNNTVRVDLPESVSLGSYTVRIAAADNTLRAISAADAEPFKLVESTVSVEDQLPIDGYGLGQNFPNPVSHLSQIRFQIPGGNHVEIVLHDLLGKSIRVLVDEWRGPGEHRVELETGTLPAGLYFYSMRAGEFHGIRKMQVVH